MKNEFQKDKPQGFILLFISEDVFVLFPYMFFFFLNLFFLNWCGWSFRNNKSNRIVTNSKQRFLFFNLFFCRWNKDVNRAISDSTTVSSNSPSTASTPQSPRGLETSPSPLMDVAWINPSQVLPSELASMQTRPLLLATSWNFRLNNLSPCPSEAEPSYQVPPCITRSSHHRREPAGVRSGICVMW